MNVDATVHPKPASVPNGFARKLLRHETLLAVFVIAGMAFLSTRSTHFLTVDNLLNQGRLMAEVGLIAVAMTFVIVTGGIDLSVGSIFGLTAIVLGVTWQNLGLPLPFAMAVALAAGILAGLVNGLIITRFGVPPLIATLSTLMLYRGLAEGISEGRSVRGYPEWFLELGTGDVAGVPIQLWVLLVVGAVAAVVLGMTTFGRATYAIGSNEVATRFSGIDVDGTKLWIYALAGTLSSTAAIIFVARVSTTRSDMGSGLELDAITAVILGGSSIFGGRGTIVGTLLGLVMIQMLKSGLTLAGVKGDGSIVVIGLILILAVLLGSLVSRDGDN